MYTDVIYRISLKKYYKYPKNLDTQKFPVITITFEQGGFTIE